MATKDYYKGITIQYKGDSTELSAVLASMNKDMRQSQGAARALNTALKLDPTSTALVKDKMEVVAKQIETTKQRVDVLKQALSEAKDPEVITRLTQQTHIAEARLKSLTSELDELNRMSGATDLGATMKSLGELGEAVSDIGGKMSGIGDKLTMSLTAPITALGVTTVQTATTIDSALTDVKKTVDGTAEQYEQLKEAAIEYSKTNAVSAEEVLQVQALGAQLGYAIDELEMIGRVGTGLDIATNMNAEQATTELAQFANITGMAHDQSSNYASTLVALGNTTATTESNISSMAQRIAAAGTQVGMSQSEILGLSAALSSVGMEAEAGGTAISTIISQIDKDVATGSEKVGDWAQAAGMSASEFAEAWRTSPVTALQALLSNMGDVSRAGGNMSVMLEELGVSSIRQTDALKRLANDSSILSKAVETANVAWQQNTALSDEVANRNDSLAAKMQMLQNRVTAIMERIGKPIADALLDIMDAAKPLFDAIESGAKAFSDMDKEQQKAIVAALGVAAALGPVLSVSGRLVSGIGDLITVVGAAGESLSGISVGSVAATAGLAALVAYVAGDVTATLVGMAQNSALVRQATEGVAQSTSMLSEGADGAASSLGGYASAASDASGESATLSSALADASEGLKAAADYASNARETLSEVGSNTAEVERYADTIKELSSQGELTASQQVILANAVEQYNEKTGAAVEVTDALSGTLNLLPSEIDEVTEAYRRQAEQQAYIELYNDAIKAQAENQQKLAQVAGELGDAANDANNRVKVGIDLFSQLSNIHTAADMYKLEQSFQGLRDSGDELATAVSYWEQKIESLGDSGHKFSSLQAAMSAAGVTGEQYASLTKSQLAELESAFDGTISSISGLLQRFGFSVGDLGKSGTSQLRNSLKSGLSDLASDVGSATDKAAQAAQEAQRKANDQIVREQQRANDRLYKQQQKAFERETKELSKQLEKELKLRQAELEEIEENERKANEELLAAQRKANDEQEAELKKGLDARYSQRSKELDKEVEAARKANEKELKAMKAAQSAATKAYKAETSARVKEMEREYKRRVQLLEDEDGTSGIDARIKELNAESDAEKRAQAEREQSEKISELQREVERAKSRRKRAEAEKALNDYLAEIAAEKREQDRKDEISRLEDQKDLIKQETEQKKDALREQYESQKEIYQQQRDEQAERDQEAYDLAYERRKEALDAEIEQRRENNAKILADLKERNDAQIEQMAELHERQESEYSEMLDRQLKAMRDAHSDEIDEIREHNADILDQTRESQQEQLEAMREAQQDALESLRSSLDDQVDSVDNAGQLVNKSTKETINSLAKNLSSGRTTASNIAKGLENDVINAMKPIETEVPGSVKTGVNGAINALSAGRSPSESAARSISSAVTNSFDTLPSSLDSIGKSSINNLASGISYGGDSARTEARSIADGVEDPLSSLSSYSHGWGFDAGDNFFEGLKATADSIWQQAANIAQGVADYLHFTVPDKGAMKDEDKWGGHLVMNLVDDMAAHEPYLIRQAQRIARLVEENFSPNLAARYDASLSYSADRTYGAARRDAFASAAPQISVELRLGNVNIASGMDIRTTARDLATETARELAAAIA